MTTPQIYGLFAMLTVAAIAGLIFYCIGLRTGRAAGEAKGFDDGRATARTYWKGIIRNIREAHTSTDKGLRAQIDNLKHEMKVAETDREGVILNLLQELEEEAAQHLTEEDLLQIQLAAKQLSIAAKQHERSGSTKANQPALARDQLNAIAARIRQQLDQAPLTRHPADRCRQ